MRIKSCAVEPHDLRRPRVVFRNSRLMSGFMSVFHAPRTLVVTYRTDTDPLDDLTVYRGWLDDSKSHHRDSTVGGYHTHVCPANQITDRAPNEKPIGPPHRNRTVQPRGFDINSSITITPARNYGCRARKPESRLS